jgi:hypothetical protein
MPSGHSQRPPIVWWALHMRSSHEVISWGDETIVGHFNRFQNQSRVAFFLKAFENTFFIFWETDSEPDLSSLSEAFAFPPRRDWKVLSDFKNSIFFILTVCATADWVGVPDLACHMTSPPCSVCYAFVFLITGPIAFQNFFLCFLSGRDNRYCFLISLVSSSAESHFTS